MKAILNNGGVFSPPKSDEHAVLTTFNVILGNIYLADDAEELLSMLEAHRHRILRRGHMYPFSFGVVAEGISIWQSIAGTDIQKIHVPCETDLEV